MVALVVRILVVIFLVGFIGYLIKTFAGNFSTKGQCPKCKGQGYWIGTRGRERCDLCRGSGKAVED